MEREPCAKAITDKYYWSQSLQEVTMEVEVGDCKARSAKTTTHTQLRDRWTNNHAIPEGSLAASFCRPPR